MVNMPQIVYNDATEKGNIHNQSTATAVYLYLKFINWRKLYKKKKHKQVFFLYNEVKILQGKERYLYFKLSNCVNYSVIGYNLAFALILHRTILS